MELPLEAFRLLIHRATRASCLLIPVTAFALLAGAFAANSGAGSGKTTTINVTSTVFDTDNSGVSLLFRSDDYSGTNQATYNSAGIASFIDSAGVWYLELYGQKTGTRTVYVTPDDPVGSQPTAPPAGYYWQSVEITSKCMDSNGNTVPFPNLTNGSSNCTFGTDFRYNAITYKLLINRLINTTDPTSGKASVACNAVNSSNQCVAWTITAGNGTSPAVSNLYSYTGPTSAPWVFIGQYYNSVRVYVHNP